MKAMATQPGMTPPAPGQEKEEPDLWQEDDIPSDDDRGSASRDGSDPPQREERIREGG